MPTDVDAASLTRLLELQEQDTAIRRLEHQRDSLPEAQRLRELREQLAEVEADLDIATRQRDGIAREQTRLEDEASTLTSKLEREEKRMYSGGVSNPKELSSLQAEVEMLKTKRSGLEDGLLEVMVQRDSATSLVESLEEERARLSSSAQDLGARVEELTAEIDGKLREHGELRGRIASSIPEELLTSYESIRDSKGGVGAAALEQGTCQGCHTKLPAAEVERLRAEGGLQRCDHCRRILVIV